MIDTLVNTNNQLITDMGDIYRQVDAEINDNVDTPESIDMVLVNSLQGDSISIHKKIKDNLVTIKDLTAKNILSIDYYQAQSNNFLMRTSHISNTVPLIFLSGTMISFSAIFRNLGLFYSWTPDKLIALQVKFVDGDNNVISTNEFLLDTMLPENSPGTETENGDYLKDKTFNVSMFVIPVAPGDYTFILTVRNPDYEFSDSFKVNVTITL
jgi:hypothetical protein